MRARVQWTAAWLLAALALTPAAHASAQAPRVIVIFEADAKAPVSADETAAARALVDALGMQGLRIVELAEARARLGDGVACEPRECAAKCLNARLADMSAAVTVWNARDSEHARVHVTLTDRDAHRYEGDADIEAGDVRGAATRALLEARALQMLGPGPWLRIDGAPDGAEVRLEGRVVGTLPYRAAIRPGRYQLVISAEGYAPTTRTIDVPDADDRKVELRVELEPGAIPSPTGQSQAATAADGASKAWMIAPIVLGSAGVLLAGFTTVRLISGSDDCANADAGGRCTERRTTQVAPTVIYYAASGALVTTALVWLVLGLRDDGAASEHSAARAGLRGSITPGGFALSGTF